MKKITLLAPIILLIIITSFVFIYLISDKKPSQTPSAFLDKDMPFFKTQNIKNANQVFSRSDLNNKFVLINFFASWCAPCKAEHHFFFEIKEMFPNLFILGFNYKDKENDAINYLSQYGDPYSFVGKDSDGMIGFEFGVFGLPETFLVNNKGKVIFKHIGPLTTEIINEKIKPLL